VSVFVLFASDLNVDDTDTMIHNYFSIVLMAYNVRITYSLCPQWAAVLQTWN